MVGTEGLSSSERARLLGLLADINLRLLRNEESALKAMAFVQALPEQVQDPAKFSRLAPDAMIELFKNASASVYRRANDQARRLVKLADEGKAAPEALRRLAEFQAFGLWLSKPNQKRVRESLAAAQAREARETVEKGTKGWDKPVEDAAVPGASKPRPAAKETALLANLVGANTRFAWKLYSALREEDGAGKNNFISPLSVSIALSMVLNGAQGGTLKEMAEALAVQGIGLDDLNNANAALLQALESLDPKVKLEIANSLWAKEGLPFKPEFLEKNRGFFRARAESLDFNDPKAPGTINAWVSDKTHGMITQIIDRLSAADIMVLINAIYFKGIWTKEFDKKRTAPIAFHLLSGKDKQVPMMRQDGEFPYREELAYQAVSLPYGGGRIAMDIILPSAGTSLAQLESWLPHALGGASQRTGSVALPRFKMEYEAKLKGILSRLGMAKAFTSEAEFAGLISGMKAWIGEVIHKAVVDVNEEGTEAAAVTAVVMRTTTAMPSTRPFRMVMDRPFFFAIRDKATGAVLFMGSVVEP